MQAETVDVELGTMAKGGWGGKRENQTGRPRELVGRKNKLVVLDKASFQAIAQWRKRYGVASDSEAVREMLVCAARTLE